MKKKVSKVTRGSREGAKKLRMLEHYPRLVAENKRLREENERLKREIENQWEDDGTFLTDEEYKSTTGG